MSTSSFSRLICLTVLTPLVVVGCGGAPAEGPPGAGAGGRGGGPGVPVEMVTLAPVPVEDASEFVGTVKSRRSTVVQSQVEGFLTRIAVTSGARVTPGTVLFEIDSTSQQAAVAALESTKAAREADAAFAYHVLTATMRDPVIEQTPARLHRQRASQRAATTGTGETAPE